MAQLHRGFYVWSSFTEVLNQIEYHHGMPCISLKVRLYPTKRQERVLNDTLETCRRAYNRLLADRKEAWEQRQQTVSCFAQQKTLAALKSDWPQLGEVYSQVLQNVAVRVDLAFKAFFLRAKEQNNKDGGRLRAGYPRFRSAGWYDSFTYPQFGFALQTDAVQLAKIGAVPAVVHRKIDGKVKTCTVRRQNGKWFACFVISLKTQHDPKSVPPPSDEAVGIDVGLASFATLSTGEKVENPRFFRQDEKALAKAQRRMSKFAKGTAERRKARKVVARIHERIRNRRHNFTHQTARRIVHRFKMIAVEKLEPQRMQKNHCLAKSIADAAWSQFRMVLTHKAASAGRQLVAVNPAYTSQDCYKCGQRTIQKLSERWHCCSLCGASLDRDLNAALNILALGTQSFR
jgi:putative transposase